MEKEHRRRLSPPLEDDWPGERDPGGLDAEIANLPLDTLFVESFRQALLAGRDHAAGGLDFFDEGSVWGPLRSPAAPAAHDYHDEPSYPLILFSRVVYPPNHEFAAIVQHFWTFKSSTPFLARVPKGMFKTSWTPPYQLFAMACLGLVVSPVPIGAQSSEGHWWTATALVHGNMEVDNREARNFALVIAWILLETYGVLHADPAVWRRTNVTQGYVETATRRMLPKLNAGTSGRHHLSHEGAVFEWQANSIISYFLLVDLLRAIHYGLSASLTVAELFIPLLAAPHDLNALYKLILREPQSLPTILPADDVLLLLIALLADINILSTTFLPLAESLLDHINDHSDCEASSITRSYPESSVFRDPFLPFSPHNEASRATQQLTQVLKAIGEAYLGKIDQNSVALYHFCRMLLAFPGLQALVVLSKYPPRMYFNTVPESILQQRATEGLRNGEQALASAWRILESLGERPGLEAVWLPIAVFYAGIVVWGMIVHDGAGKGVHGSLRVLSLFCAKLDTMRWPCCRAMSEHLQMLMARAAIGPIIEPQ